MDVGRWIALLGLSIPLYATITLSPLLNGAAMDRLEIDSLEIGGIRTFEILTNAVLTISLAPRLARFEAKRLGLIGAGAMALAGLASALADAPASLLGARILAGAGAGLCQCALAILMAETRSPQKVGGSLLAPITAFAIATALIGGRVTQAFGHHGAFLCLATACSIGFFLAYAGPRSAAGARTAPANAAVIAAPATSLGALRSPYVLAAALVFLGSSATWTFFERKGRSLGMETADISNVIAAALVCAGIFASLSMLVRDRWVRAFTIGAVAIFAASAAATALSNSAVIFAGAYIIQTIAYAWTQNLLTAMGVRIDPSGGLAAAGRGWQTLVNSAAPALGGALVLLGGFHPLAALCAVAGIWSVFFLIRSEKIA
jgi:MFS family permease